MYVELKVYRDDMAQPVAVEAVPEPYGTRADALSKEHHLGAFFRENSGGEILYENGMIYVTALPDPE